MNRISLLLTFDKNGIWQNPKLYTEIKCCFRDLFAPRINAIEEINPVIAKNKNIIFVASKVELAPQSYVNVIIRMICDIRHVVASDLAV